MVFHLLIQQGRVVDRTAGGVIEANTPVHASSGLVGSNGQPGETLHMERLRAASAGMGRGYERGLMTDHHSDVVTAVDMSTPDQEPWLARTLPLTLTLTLPLTLTRTPDQEPRLAVLIT